uniref:1-alkyl-2-acetylglycerophosphocholine esterase n=1 Tax=Globisporangium ultimum (strain ATCC 200006 / CBS 805.95 / DAOM BR144) TaxID=431595 RepID=K3XBA9_GLOUD
MTILRYRLVEYAVLAASVGVLAVEYLQQQFASTKQYVVTQIALALLIGVLMLFHHTRRELTPLYLSMLVYVAKFVVREPIRTLLAGVLYKASVVGVVSALVLVAVFPWPDFSELHGEFKTVGVRTGRYGGIECRVFYPSAKTASTLPASKRAKLLHHGKHLLKGMSIFSGVPQWVFGCLQNGYLAAVPYAPLAAPEEATTTNTKKWPVAIFSHGLGGCFDVYSAITQQLASEGYIVVSVNHCDGSASVTRLEDNRIAYYQKITPEVRDNINGAGFRFRNGQLRQRVQEVRRVLDAITHEHSKHEVGNLFELADMDNVTVIGHSFGGATALTTAHLDERVRAVVLLDAWMEPIDADVKHGLGSRTPVFHLMSEHFYHWNPNLVDMKVHTKGCTHVDTKLTVLLGSRHNNFCDLPVFSPLVNRVMKSSGKIDPAYALHTMSQLSAAFLRGSYASTVSLFPEILELDATKE